VLPPKQVALFSHTRHPIAQAMPVSGKEKEEQQRKEELEGIARISLDIRRAVIAALPAPPEQFLTLNVPGKVLNFMVRTVASTRQRSSPSRPSSRTIPTAGTRTAPPSTSYPLSAFSSTRPSFAMTCQPSAVYSSVRPVEPSPEVTARRSASSARPVGVSLRKMCTISDPSSVGSTAGIPDNSGDLTDEEKRYQAAMEWLLEKDPEHPSLSHIDLYKEKQTEYTEAFERKIKAFNDALDRITQDTRFPTIKDQREAYDRWVQENQKTYNNHVQAAYMDWVTTGKKEEVEYYFAVVDNESAMSRVEASKVSVWLS